MDLYTWGSENETWYQSSKNLKEIEDVNDPLAWVASNANISSLPPGWTAMPWLGHGAGRMRTACATTGRRAR